MKKRKQQKNQNFSVLFLVAGGILLVLGSVMLLSQNRISQPASQTPVSSGHEEDTYPEIERVSLEDAKAALDAGTTVFVDVRGTDAYAMSHIPGSLSIPLADLEARLGELDPNQWIITYCT